MKTYIILLAIVILAGCFTSLIGQSPHEMFRFDASLRQLFPYDGKSLPNLKDLDELSIQRVVSILINNIKQWSFVESQLLEPNMNVAMPEIFIPLGHLTTTLEALGNIHFMRNQFVEARAPLERACPLMELLPSEFHEGQQYTISCYKVLRECYKKIYISQKTLKSRSLPPSKSSRNNVDRASSMSAATRSSKLDTSENYYDDDIDYRDDEEEDDSYERLLDEVLLVGGNDGDGSDEKIKSLIENRIIKLRAPFDHLRSEHIPSLPIGLSARSSNYKTSRKSITHAKSRQSDPLLQTRQTNAGRRHQLAPDLKYGSDAATAVYGDEDDEYEDGSDEYELQSNDDERVDSGNKANQTVIVSGSSDKADSSSEQTEEPRHRAVPGSLFSFIEMSTGVTDDLEIFLRRFVLEQPVTGDEASSSRSGYDSAFATDEDSENRRDVLELVQTYRDNLRTSLSTSSSSMRAYFYNDLGLTEAYHDVIQRATDRGTSFVVADLAKFKESINLSESDDDEQSDDESHSNSSSFRDDMREEDADGRRPTFDDFVLLRSVDSLSRSDRNRFIVLHVLEKAMYGSEADFQNFAEQVLRSNRKSMHVHYNDYAMLRNGSMSNLEIYRGLSQGISPQYWLSKRQDQERQQQKFMSRKAKLMASKTRTSFSRLDSSGRGVGGDDSNSDNDCDGECRRKRRVKHMQEQTCDEEDSMCSSNSGAGRKLLDSDASADLFSKPTLVNVDDGHARVIMPSVNGDSTALYVMLFLLVLIIGVVYYLYHDSYRRKHSRGAVGFRNRSQKKSAVEQFQYWMHFVLNFGQVSSEEEDDDGSSGGMGVDTRDKKQQRLTGRGKELSRSQSFLSVTTADLHTAYISATAAIHLFFVECREGGQSMLSELLGRPAATASTAPAAASKFIGAKENKANNKDSSAESVSTSTTAAAAAVIVVSSGDSRSKPNGSVAHVPPVVQKLNAAAVSRRVAYDSDDSDSMAVEKNKVSKVVGKPPSAPQNRPTSASATTATSAADSSQHIVLQQSQQDMMSESAFQEFLLKSAAIASSDSELAAILAGGSSGSGQQFTVINKKASKLKRGPKDPSSSTSAADKQSHVLSKPSTAAAGTGGYSLPAHPVAAGLTRTPATLPSAISAHGSSKPAVAVVPVKKYSTSAEVSAVSTAHVGKLSPEELAAESVLQQQSMSKGANVRKSNEIAPLVNVWQQAALPHKKHGTVVSKSSSSTAAAASVVSNLHSPASSANGADSSPNAANFSTLCFVSELDTISSHSSNIPHDHLSQLQQSDPQLGYYNTLFSSGTVSTKVHTDDSNHLVDMGNVPSRFSTPSTMLHDLASAFSSPRADAYYDGSSLNVLKPTSTHSNHVDSVVSSLDRYNHQQQQRAAQQFNSVAQYPKQPAVDSADFDLNEIGFGVGLDSFEVDQLVASPSPAFDFAAAAHSHQLQTSGNSDMYEICHLQPQQSIETEELVQPSFSPFNSVHMNDYVVDSSSSQHVNTVGSLGRSESSPALALSSACMETSKMTSNAASAADDAFDLSDMVLQHSSLSAQAPSFNPGYAYAPSAAAAAVTERISYLNPYNGSPLSQQSTSKYSVDEVSCSPSQISLPPAATVTGAAAGTRSLQVHPSTQRSDSLTLLLTCDCSVFSLSDVRMVKIVSGAFGGWSLNNAIAMRRSITNPAIWGLALELPQTVFSLEYRYIVLDSDGHVWVESSANSRNVLVDPTIPLVGVNGVVGAAPSEYEQEDVLVHPIQIGNME